MSYTGGIDSQLRNLVDANYGNPNALIQEQKLNPDTLKLLAIEKLNRDVRQREQELQASMPNQQGTIADQRMAEALENTKKEIQGGIKDVAARVGATNNQEAQRQQQNMQRVAQQGVATQPAPNMARMAGGGIVAFADGSLVNAQNLTEEQIQFLRSKGLNDAQIASMTPDKLRAAMSAVPSSSSGLLNKIRKGVGFKVPPRRPAGYGYNPLDYAPELGGVPEGYEEKIRRRNELQANNPIRKNIAFQRREFTPSPAGQQALPLAAEDIGPLGPEDFWGDIAEADQKKAIDQKQAIVGTLSPAMGTLNPAVGGAAKPNAGIPAAIPIPNIASVGPATAGVGSLLQDAQGAETARRDAVDWAGGVLNREGHAAQRADMLRRLQEDNRVSGEEREYWALNDMLARAGGQGALSNIARGAADMRTAARREDKADLARELGLEEKGIKGDVDIATAQVIAGTAASKAALEKAARDTLNDIRRQQKNATSASARQKLFVNVTKAIAELKQKNSADVEERISGDVSMLPIRQAAREGDPKAIAQVEAFKKKAREEAYTEVSNTLNELERLRAALSRQIGGWGSSVKPVSPPAKQQAEHS